MSGRIIKEVIVERSSTRNSRKKKRSRRRRAAQAARGNPPIVAGSHPETVIVERQVAGVSRRQRRSNRAGIARRAGVAGMSADLSGNAQRQNSVSVQNKVLSRNKLSGDYVHIQGAIAAPQVVPPERFSTEYAGKPTAIANPWTIEDYPWGATNNPNDSPLGASELFLVAFRDPVRNHVFYNENPGAGQSDLQAWITPLSGTSSVAVPEYDSTGAVNEFEDDLHIPFWKATSTFQPHGPYLYAGSDERSERTYRWFDKGETVKVLVGTNVSTDIDVDLSLDLFEQDALIEEAFRATGTATGTSVEVEIEVTKGGYYSLHLFATFAAPTTFSVSATSTCTSAMFCHRPIPGFASNQMAIDGIRMTGVAAMYTNNAAPLQRAGTIAGFQVPKETDWQQYVGTLSLVSKSNGARTMEIQNGLYGFLKPTENEDFELQDVFATDPVSGTITASYFSLRNPKSFLILRGSVVPSDGRSGYFTISNSVEYLTSDVWRQLDIPRTDADIYKKALSEIKGIDQWHENPLHIKELFSKILNGSLDVAKSVQKYLPGALAIGDIMSQMLLL